MIAADTLPCARATSDLLPSDRLLWTVLTGIAATIPAWEGLVGVDITGLGRALAIAAALLGLRAIYVTMRPGARIVHTLLETSAGAIAYTAIMAPVSYLCARNAMPVFDDALRRGDAWLGYDWAHWAAVESSIPALAVTLRLAYASLLPQTVLLLTILPLFGDGQRGYRLIRASLIGVILACAGSFLFPATGPNAQVTDWYAPWVALRTADPFTASLREMQGIIAFPSFHACLAVIFFQSVRGLGLLTWAFGALELLMLASTPTFGHHYLCDVIAGIAVAIVSLTMTNRLDHWFPLSPVRTARAGSR